MGVAESAPWMAHGPDSAMDGPTERAETTPGQASPIPKPTNPEQLLLQLLLLNATWSE
ncbi:hypothetical protein GCM10027191_20270 [Novilysobacter erysipheiresistens]